MSTAIWQVDWHPTDETHDPVVYTTRHGLAVRSARGHTIHCRRNHRPTFNRVGLVSNKERLDAIEILSYHLGRDDRWIGIFEDQDVLSPQYMDRIAIPFHKTQWSEILVGCTGLSVQHRSLQTQHRLIAKSTDIKTTVRCMETGATMPPWDMSSWVSWAVLVAAIATLITTLIVFL